LARVVLLGTGSSALLRAAEEPTLRGTSLDDIATVISAALRKRAGQVAHQLARADHHWLAGQLAVLVGFSEACGRMVAYSFSGSSFFEPIVTARLIQPEPDGVFIEPSAMPELVACARQQLACVRDTYPEASGGT